MSFHPPSIRPPPARQRCSLLVMAVLSTLLRAALSSSKVVLLLLVLINIHNFPLVWHFRLLFCELLPEVGRTLAKRPWWYLRFRGKSAITRSDVRPVLRTADIYPGTRVFDLRWTRTGRVWPDMADYNLHMSNSSYGWEMDMCRMRFWVRFFPRMISSDGGFSALGGADYTFHAEVPLFGKFNLETSILTWDDKWICTSISFLALTVLSRAVSTAQNGAWLAVRASRLRAGPLLQRRPLMTRAER